MAALRAALLGLALSAAMPAHAQSVADWKLFIDEASTQFGIPAEWIKRVMGIESGGRMVLAGRPITSRAGAMGLMQLMPGTWSEMRAAYGLGADPYDPHDNILAGTAYLRVMYDRFGYPGMFAAYNAGPGRYGDYVEHLRPLPGETRAYLARVTGSSPHPSANAAAVSRPGLFVVLAGNGPISPLERGNDKRSALFVTLSSR